MRTHPGFFTSPLPSDRAAFTIISVGESEMLPLPARFRRDQGWHSYQLMFAIEGEGVGDDTRSEFHARVHDVVLMPKSRAHGYEVAPGHALWRYLWVEFDGGCVTQVLQMLGLQDRLHVSSCAAVREPIEQIFTYLQTRGDAALHEASTLFLHVLSLIERAARAPQPNSAPAATIDDVKKHMVDHLAQGLCLADLAAVARMSPFHLNRIFRQRTGVPPMRYLRQLRANRAKTLLLKSHCKFSEIGRAVGYPVPQHFSRMFSQETGMTPRRFVSEITRTLGDPPPGPSAARS